MYTLFNLYGMLYGTAKQLNDNDLNELVVVWNPTGEQKEAKSLPINWITLNYITDMTSKTNEYFW